MTIYTVCPPCTATRKRKGKRVQKYVGPDPDSRPASWKASKAKVRGKRPDNGPAPMRGAWESRVDPMRQHAAAFGSVSVASDRFTIVFDTPLPKRFGKV